MPINSNKGDLARAGLVTFFYETNTFLRNLSLESGELFIEVFRPQIKNAWNEFAADFDMDDAIERINNLSDEKLQRHGLYGNQLALKMSAIEYWRDKFSITDIIRNKKIEFLKWLIDAIDTLLESLLEVTGISGAIKEIKDCLRNLLDVLT